MDIESRGIKKVKQEQAALRKTAANIAKEVRTELLSVTIFSVRNVVQCGISCGVY